MYIKNIVKRILLSILCYIGLLLYLPVRLWKQRTFRLNNIRRILILAVYSGVGNIILLTPFLNTLKKSLPNVYVTVLIGSIAGRDILEQLPFVDEVIYSDVKDLTTLKAIINFFKNRFVSKQFDLVIATSIEPSFDSSLMAFFSKAPYRITFNKGIDGFLDTFSLRTDDAKHEVERHLDIARFLGIETVEHNLCLLTSDKDESFADQFLARYQKTVRGPLIGIHPGAGGTSISPLYEKRWPLERFVMVADRLMERYGTTVLFLGGPDDKDLWGPIQKLARYDHIFATNQTVLQTAALVRHCNLFISNDSGLMHVAAAMKVPTVAIFGPTIPWKNHPWGTEYTLIKKDLPCSPCYSWPFEPPCQGAMQCLHEISVDRVLQASGAVSGWRLLARSSVYGDCGQEI